MEGIFAAGDCRRGQSLVVSCSCRRGVGWWCASWLTALHLLLRACAG